MSILQVHKEKMEEFDDKFTEVKTEEDIVLSQTHHSYPCYLSHFQKECVEEHITSHIIAILEEQNKYIDQMPTILGGEEQEEHVSAHDIISNNQQIINTLREL